MEENSTRTSLFTRDSDQCRISIRHETKDSVLRKRQQSQGPSKQMERVSMVSMCVCVNYMDRILTSIYIQE